MNERSSKATSAVCAPQLALVTGPPASRRSTRRSSAVAAEGVKRDFQKICGAIQRT
jgi:hypothetical protein